MFPESRQMFHESRTWMVVEQVEHVLPDSIAVPLPQRRKLVCLIPIGPGGVGGGIQRLNAGFNGSTRVLL
jgi:hypothetical protein